MSRLAALLAQRMRMLREDAAAVAKVVDEAFAGQSELDDEVLDKDLRQVFYNLQDEKVLDIRREERRGDGGLKRHYLWRVRDDLVGDVEVRPARDATERLYGRLDDEAWSRRRPDEPFEAL